MSSCRKCRNKHNTLLHKENQVSNSQDQVVCSIQNDIHTTCLLSTAIINVLNSEGRIRVCRVLLDSGSQSHFITKGMADSLNLEIFPDPTQINGVNNCKTNIEGRCQLAIKSRYNLFSANINCLVINEITGPLPQIKISGLSIKSWDIPKHIVLADPNFGTPSEIDLLIGASLFWELISENKIQLGKDAPILQETQLGWVLSGQISHTKYSNIDKHCFLVKNSINKNCEVQQQLAKFWEIEECPIENVLSDEEQLCENHFRDNFKRVQDGRFMVAIPYKKSIQLLGESKFTAKTRFFSLERKLNSNPTLKAEYGRFMMEYQNLNHMSKVQLDDTPEIEYFMPHHGVINQASKTTKLRVVFDASCATKSGYSLNNLQCVGPRIQNDLFSILLRFRQYKIAISADITKMYRQILVEPKDRAFQRILWRTDPSLPLSIYELNTVTYGTAAASFLAIRCLFQLAIESFDQFQNACATIMNDFYVDDLLSGADSSEEAIVLSKQISNILQGGCLPLTKWLSNSAEFLDKIKETDETSILNLGANENAKTLGLHWDASSDKLLFKINVPSKGNVTKRNILSTISQVFDPLGLLGACLIQAKILLQNLWIEKKDWDEPVSESCANQWNAFRDNLSELNQLKIPRHVISECNYFELHGFADASEKAYGACIYILSKNHTDSRSTCKLLCSKSKVSPLKTITIPRLELCASLLLAQLISKVRSSLRINFTNISLWSDSSVVLCWLKTSPHLLKIFVSTRVKKIQELTKEYHWRHVPSTSNPADSLSRGICANELINSKLWWEGPNWLKDSPEDWPKIFEVPKELPELKPTRVYNLAISKFENIKLNSFSKFSKLTRILAYCHRFYKNCKLEAIERSSGSLKIQELRLGSISAIKLAQSEEFAQEIHELRSNRPINPKSSILSLNPYLDSDNVLRLRGRLENSELGLESKFPIILPANHYVTQLIFQEEHEKLGHVGPLQLLYAIRDKYWPVRGRNMAKNIVHRCIKCYRANPINGVPKMGVLPKERVTPSYPFLTTGVDYAGPFSIKNHKGRGSKLSKCYLSLFVCFSTKAVHIEVVSDLSTEAFLAALKRFVARRGKPNTIHSDNGTNFKGANNELQSFLKLIKNDNEKITDCLAKEGIKWQFIPASAPHFGGLWESGVKRAKFHLKRMAGEIPLTFEEMCTLTIQIEAILNSRPLSPLSNDPTDLEPLTPGHFLIGRKLTAVEEPAYTELPVNRLSSFEKIQQIIQHFWKRWSSEYLPELQPRKKWKSSASPNTIIKVGDLVLIKDDHQPPLKWPLGRITELIQGKDGIARVAEVRTTRGILRRPMVKLFPLPVQ